MIGKFLCKLQQRDVRAVTKNGFHVIVKIDKTLISRQIFLFPVIKRILCQFCDDMTILATLQTQQNFWKNYQMICEPTQISTANSIPPTRILNSRVAYATVAIQASAFDTRYFKSIKNQAIYNQLSQIRYFKAKCTLLQNLTNFFHGVKHLTQFCHITILTAF